MLERKYSSTISFFRRFIPVGIKANIRKLLKVTVNFLFHVLFFDERKWQFKWLGIECWQNTFDLWIKQEIIYEIKPDCIIETGTAYGGTALFYAILLEQIGKGQVISIDIEPKIEDASKYDVFNKRCTIIKGNSISQEVYNEVSKKIDVEKVIVILDSDHSKKHVLREMELYSQFVSINSYLIVEDTNLDIYPINPYLKPGPYEAIREFLMHNDNFIIDKNRERLPITTCPSGYLKRIK